MDLSAPPDWGQQIHWASIIGTIVLHSGVLSYIFLFARAFEPHAAHGWAATVEAHSRTGPEPLPRGDREDISWVAPIVPLPTPAADASAPLAPAVPQDEGPHPAAAALLEQIEGLLPEDAGASPMPVMPARKLALILQRMEVQLLEDAGASPMPETAVRKLALTPQRMEVQLPEDAGASPILNVPALKLAETPQADPLPDAGPRGSTVLWFQRGEESTLPERAGPTAADRGAPDEPQASSLEPLPEDQAVSLDQRRAAAWDAGVKREPVAAMLPKPAAPALFAPETARQALLAEDRSVAPRSLQAKPDGEVAVPPPSRRQAQLAAPKRIEHRTAKPKPDEAETANDGPGASASARAYRSQVRSHLAAHRPGSASTSGSAVVAFTLSPNGGVTSSSIVSSSGNPLLDESVLESVRRADPFPKAPKGIKSTQRRFRIPFQFR